MANVVDLINNVARKSSVFNGLPLNKLDERTGHNITEALVQYVSVNPWTGFQTQLPDYIQSFIVRTPFHPALGKGFANSRLGFTLSWVQPEVKVGDKYLHFKPPVPPVEEEHDRHDVKLQCSSAYRTEQFMDQYIDGEVVRKLISFHAGLAVSANVNTVSLLFQYFWIALMTGEDKAFVLDKQTMFLLNKKLTAAEADKSQKLLQSFQENMEPYFKNLRDRAKKIKNREYYDPSLRPNWRTKGENAIEIKKIVKPANVNDVKTFIKALYTVESGGKQNTPELTRGMCVYALLNKIKKRLNWLTRSPRPDNCVLYDTNTEESENTVLYPSRTTRENLIIVVSSWDYDDLMDGVSVTGNSPISKGLRDIASDIQVISIDGIPPGFAYVGERAIFNMAIRLDHSGSIFHFREEETQYYNNKWLALWTHTKYVCGSVISPCSNYLASGEFYEHYSDVINEA